MKTINSIIRKKTIVIPALLILFTMATSCSESSLTIDDLSAPERIITADLTAGMITNYATFDPNAGELPESIAVDRFGNIYVSMIFLQEIWKLNPDGSFNEVVASFPMFEGLFGGVAGLRFDAQGNLYAAVTSTYDDVQGFWKFSPNGEKERIPGTADISIKNDIAISPSGTLYMTDSAGAIWIYTGRGPAEIWVEDEILEGTGEYGLGFEIGANGIVYVPGKKMPFARNSGQKTIGGVLVANAEKGQLVYIPILRDGSAGEPFVVISDPILFGLDGITMDARGNIYGAVNMGNSVVQISRDGTTITEIAQGGLLDFPTGLTFGTGPEKNTLFVVNAAFFTPLDIANPAVISISLDPGN